MRRTFAHACRQIESQPISDISRSVIGVWSDIGMDRAKQILQPTRPCPARSRPAWPGPARTHCFTSRYMASRSARWNWLLSSASAAAAEMHAF